jgi:hypothetical protein
VFRSSGAVDPLLDALRCPQPAERRDDLRCLEVPAGTSIQSLTGAEVNHSGRPELRTDGKIVGEIHARTSSSPSARSPST